jgi:hypothetical protein
MPGVGMSCTRILPHAFPLPHLGLAIPHHLHHELLHDILWQHEEKDVGVPKFLLIWLMLTVLYV